MLPVVGVRGCLRGAREGVFGEGFTADPTRSPEHPDILAGRIAVQPLNDAGAERGIEQGAIGGHADNEIGLRVPRRSPVAIEHIGLVAVRPGPDRSGEARKHIPVRRNHDDLVDALNLTGPIVHALQHRDAAHGHQDLPWESSRSQACLNKDGGPGMMAGPLTGRTGAIG